MMNRRFGSVILSTAFRFVVPVLILFGFYVLFHGEISPGGGFQAGALFAIAVLLSEMIQGNSEADFALPEKLAVPFAGLGTFIYLSVGILTVVMGGNFLAYGFLPFSLHEPELHALGILGIEIGVTICVFATIIAIFNALAKSGEDDA